MQMWYTTPDAIGAQPLPSDNLINSKWPSMVGEMVDVVDDYKKDRPRKEVGT